MAIDLNEFMEQRKREQDKLAAEARLVVAQEALAEAYVSRGLPALFEQHGVEVEEGTAEAFRPLMLEAIREGLSSAEIEALILEILYDNQIAEDGDID